MDDDLLTTKAVAALLRVHPKQVYRLLRRGLPAVRVGDEWRFVRSEVLSWAATRAGRPAPSDTERGAAGSAGLTPPLLAANGDCAVELLLELLPRAGGPLLGLVTSDHAGAGALLAAGRVLIAGQHGDAVAPRDGKWGRIHLVTREVGLAAVRRSRRALLGTLPGSRLASRPSTAGIRRRLDAWASRAGLEFQALGSETYDLLIAADRLGDPAVVALCELLQSAELRKQLRTRFGYGVSKTGELRVG